MFRVRVFKTTEVTVLDPRRTFDDLSEALSFIGTAYGHPDDCLTGEWIKQGDQSVMGVYDFYSLFTQHPVLIPCITTLGTPFRCQQCVAPNFET